MASRTFRAGVVTVVERSDGQILAFERIDTPGAWQLPQGGIDVAEAPQQAAWRELAEETALTSDQVALVGEHPDWIAYAWPPEVVTGKRLGQVQRWFTFRVRADDVEPTPDGHEFGAWRWVTRAWMLDHVVEFRRPAYRRGLGGDG